MEFHIAQQVIEGRRKYLIPIFMNNVQIQEIKDADLRMYLENHTYLDRKDKVK